MIFRNYMEVVVGEELDKITKKNVDVCRCARCRNDILAHALNQLPSRYIVSNDMYTKMDMLRGQFAIDVISRLVEAVEVVKANPRHSEADLGGLE